MGKLINSRMEENRERVGMPDPPNTRYRCFHMLFTTIIVGGSHRKCAPAQIPWILLFRYRFDLPHMTPREAITDLKRLH